MLLLKWIGGLVFAVLLLAALAYPLADLMREPLDDAARAELLRTGKAKRFVSLTDGVMHVRIGGAGEDRPVVLLVHGGTAGGHNLEKWIEPLSGAGYHVIVPDLLGYGYSERPVVPHTADYFTGQLDELLTALGARGSIHIVGTSMGGAIVTAFARRYPERLKSVTLIAPAGNGKTSFLPAWMRWPIVGDWVFRVLGPTIFQRRIGNAPGTEGLLAWMKEQTRFRGYAEGLLNTFRNFDISWRPDDYTALGRSKLPVLVLWGTADSTIPFEQSKALLARVPQATLVSFEGKGHTLSGTDRDAVIAAVVPFLKMEGAP
jgi:pimeloyl-ACP methyl ester carboxylesterase